VSPASRSFKRIHFASGEKSLTKVLNTDNLSKLSSPSNGVRSSIGLFFRISIWSCFKFASGVKSLICCIETATFLKLGNLFKSLRDTIEPGSIRPSRKSSSADRFISSSVFAIMLPPKIYNSVTESKSSFVMGRSSALSI